MTEPSTPAVDPGLRDRLAEAIPDVVDWASAITIATTLLPVVAAWGEQQARERAAVAWDEGHSVGWQHCQDGNYGNDYWDDDTLNPYRDAALRGQA